MTQKFRRLLSGSADLRSALLAELIKVCPRAATFFARKGFTGTETWVDKVDKV